MHAIIYVQIQHSWCNVTHLRCGRFDGPFSSALDTLSCLVLHSFGISVGVRVASCCRCHSGFCPPQKVSPRTQSASGFCPGGYNPLADSVRGDTIRQRILSGETCSASGFCPSSAECVPPPPPIPTINPLHLISERV